MCVAVRGRARPLERDVVVVEAIGRQLASRAEFGSDELVLAGFEQRHLECEEPVERRIDAMEWPTLDAERVDQACGLGLVPHRIWSAVST